MNCKLLLAFFPLIIASVSFTQKNTVDSLLKVLQTQKEDTSKVNVLYALAGEFRHNKTDTAVYLANQALALAKKLNYEIGIADLKRRIGALYADQGRYDEGAESATDALSLYNKLLASSFGSDKEEILKKIGNAYNVIGHNRISQSNFSEGLKISFLALKIREELGDKKGISDTEYNIGNIYYSQHNYSEALKHYNLSLKISEQLGIKSDIAAAYNTIGLVYFEQGNYAEALKNYSVALNLAQEIKDKHTIGEIYINLGIINERQKNYSEALKYNFEALKLYGETGVNQVLPFIYNNIASVYTRQKKFDDAAVYLDKALFFSEKIGSLEYSSLSYENWAALDSAKGNYQSALKHYKLFTLYRDSMFNAANTKKIVQQQMQYNFDKKEDSLKQKQIITETQLKGQQQQMYFYWGGLAMLSILSFFVFLNFRNQKKINRLASEAHNRQKAEMGLQHLNAVMQERLRISRELHDEVGATLSGIAMYSHLTKEQIKHSNTTEVEKSLTIMQQSAGEMVNKLNDIVWLVNPDQDSLQKLIQRLEEYAGDMAMIKGMQVRITVPENIHETMLSMESRRNIYLFCKEAINNSVKYSNGTLLELSIKESEGILEFSVSDNGKGFDAVMVRRGNGLENMQKRADDIGARLLLQSKQHEGAVVSMQVKIT